MEKEERKKESQQQIMMESTVLQVNDRGISAELLHTKSHKTVHIRRRNCSRLSSRATELTSLSLCTVVYTLV
jgi:hypothetical protein